MSSFEFVISLICSVVGLLAITFISKSIELKKQRKRDEVQMLGHNLDFIDDIISSVPANLLDEPLSIFLKQMRLSYINRLPSTGSSSPASAISVPPKERRDLPRDPRKLLDISRTLKSVGKYLIRCEESGTLSKAHRNLYQLSLDKSASRIKVQQHWQQADKALKEKNMEFALHNYAMCLQQLSRHKRTVVDQQMMDKIHQRIADIKGTAETADPKVKPIRPVEKSTTEETKVPDSTNTKPSKLEEKVQDWGDGWQKKTAYD